MMIGVLLPKADPQTDDAADALAIAVCHAHHRQSAMLKVRRGAVACDVSVLEIVEIGVDIGRPVSAPAMTSAAMRE